jgi:site-specific DNA-methyltransferase (adenine-specific)
MVYDNHGITLWHGDCLEILPQGNPDNVDLLLTDPPYGVNEKTNRKENGRGNMAASYDFAPVFGDDKHFDPAHLLVFKRIVLFGANYYASRLPESPSWIVWDKLNGMTSEKREIGVSDNADLELAWTNLGGPARIIPHRWMGMIKESERRERRVHPTQKPIELMKKIIEWRTEPGDLILDPYAGSGSTLIAALQSGRRAVGIEYERAYCDVIVERLDKAAADLSQYSETGEEDVA